MTEMVPHTYSFCRRCDRRVELGRIAYGTTVACPACGLEFVVESPTQGRDGTGQGRGADAEDALREQEEHAALEAAGVHSPLDLFLSGTFTFPFRLGVLSQTLTLCFGAGVLFAVFRLGAWCAIADNEGVDKATRVLLWNGLLLSTILAAVALPAWIYAASAYGMTILRETAFGVDVIEDWPNVLALEDASQTLYVFNGLFLAVLPCALAAPLWNRLGVPLPWTIGGGIAIVFPLLLLSMLAGNSPLHFVSLRVWKSLPCCAIAWIGFHLITLAAAYAVAALEIALWRHAGWAIDVVVTGIVAAAAWTTYFRLLGRLAWLLSVRRKA
jgi:hypothetical protein